jgi:hypothetical protein
MTPGNFANSGRGHRRRRFSRLLLAGAMALALVSLPVATPAQAAAPIRVAVLGAPAHPAWNADVQAKLTATGLFAQVDVFNIRRGRKQPDLAQLRAYGAVLIYASAGIDDSIGDVLANYADLGRGVVVAGATLLRADNAIGLGGRLSTAGYLPFDQRNLSSGNIRQHLVATRPSSPLLCGVSSFDGGEGSFHQKIGLTTGAHLVAGWTSDNVPLVAWKDPVITGGSRVVGLNLFPPSSDAVSTFWDSTTDGAALMANALLFSAHRNVPCQSPS